MKNGGVDWSRIPIERQRELFEELTLGPVLVNFDGALCARYTDIAGEPLPMIKIPSLRDNAKLETKVKWWQLTHRGSRMQCAKLVPGQQIRLEMWVEDTTPAVRDVESHPLIIKGGKDSQRVPFKLEFHLQKERHGFDVFRSKDVTVYPRKGESSFVASVLFAAPDEEGYYCGYVQAWQFTAFLAVVDLPAIKVVKSAK